MTKTEQQGIRLEVIEAVEAAWRDRADAQWYDVKQQKKAAADFFAGAMSAMNALGMAPAPGWVFGIMCDRPELYGSHIKRIKGDTRCKKCGHRLEGYAVGTQVCNACSSTEGGA